MKNPFITKNSAQTRELGQLLAEELGGGEIICLTGELGSGKTTFAQGVLRGMGAKGPYTSPTFVVMKQYKKRISNFKFQILNQIQSPKSKILNIYHIDAYRVGTKDILDLGWEEIIAGKNNIVIVEWAERIKSVIPGAAVWLDFKHLKADERKIVIK